MLSKLILLFVIVPLVELALLIEIGQQIGLTSTLGLVILTGIAGAYLARSQGFYIFTQIQAELQQGRLPAESLFDGLLILVGGLLLLTPGILTDILGFLLLIPASRFVIKNFLKKKLQAKIESGEIQSNSWFF